MKILVTGATGFIGSQVMAQLAGGSHLLVATARSLDKAANSFWISKTKFIPFDLNNIADHENVFEYFERPDLLIHLAWEGLPNYGSMVHLDKNYPVHRDFLRKMIEQGLPSLVVTGTCLEYGMKNGCLSENMDTASSVPYAQAKNQLLTFVTQLQAQYAFKFKWIRLFYIYGPGQNENSLLSQLDRALQRGDEVFNMSRGQQLRDYLPVEKVAEHIVRIAMNQHVKGVINCCSGKPVTIKQFVEDYLKAKGKQIELNLGHYPYPDYEPMAFWGDTHQLEKVINDIE